MINIEAQKNFYLFSFRAMLDSTESSCRALKPAARLKKSKLFTKAGAKLLTFESFRN